MTGTTSPTGAAAPATALAATTVPTTGRPLLAVAVISAAQLMVALDATIVNIALPTAQTSLRFDDADRQWVLTAYTLALGGLLLLGGRLGDLLGRKRAFLAGVAAFAASSALAGAAPSFAVLVTGRALQGASAALLTPTALSLLAVTFTDPTTRARAFAVYGAVASSGAAGGLLLGGVLTQYSSWRWCLFLNVAVGLAAGVAGRQVLPDMPPGPAERLDVAGATLVTAGLVALTYGCSQAATAGWTSHRVALPLSSGVLLLAGFLGWQRRAARPLLPLTVLFDRDRAGACVAVAAAVVGSFGLFLLLTYYLQVVRGYSPVRTGLAFLPLTLAVVASSTGLASRLLPRVSARALITPGLLAAAVGLALLTRLDPRTAYLTGVLPAELLLGAGMGCVFTPAFSVATSGVDRRDAGVAAAVVQTANQVGASLGTAVLNTLAAAGTAGYLAGRTRDAGTVAAGLVHGYAVATGAAAGLVAVVAALVFLLIRVPAAAPQPR